MIGKRVFKAGSLRREALRLGRKWVLARLPVRAHIEIARFRSHVSRRVFGVPDRVRENMAAVLGQYYEESEIDRFAQLHTEISRRGYLVRVLPTLRGFRDPGRWPVEGLEHLDVALSEKRGVILVTGHLYYARLIPPILRLHGYEVRLVRSGRVPLEQRQKLEERLARTGQIMRDLYQRTGLLEGLDDSDNIFAGLDVRPILNSLSCNECVVITGDGMQTAEFVKLSLFGRPYPYPVGFMKIAMITGAPILPVFALEADHGCRICVRIHSPLSIDPKATVATNIEEFVRVLNDQLWQTPHAWTRWGVEDVFTRALQWSQADLRIRYSGQWKKDPLPFSSKSPQQSSMTSVANLP